MKKHITKFALFITLISFSFLASCSNDDDTNSTDNTIAVEFTEIGLENSGHATAGDDLHIEAAIVAPAKIALVTVEIHSETDSSIEEISETFTDYSGMINAEFHKHIEIPASQPAGDYHLHFTVIDEQGNTKTVEAEVEILANTDNLFQITIDELGNGTVGNSSVSAGNDLHVEGTIVSTNPIATIEIEIHNEEDNSVPGIEETYTNYAGQTNANFHEHISIPSGQPTGEYHFHFTVTDNLGNTSTVEYTLTIE